MTNPKATAHEPFSVPPLALCPNAKTAVHCEQCRVRSLSLCGALETDELDDDDSVLMEGGEPLVDACVLNPVEGEFNDGMHLPPSSLKRIAYVFIA
jgi:hypothetical protein